MKTLRINYMDDLHLEFADITLPGGDVLVLAGDIMVAGYLRHADNARRNTEIADRFRRFFREELVKYRRVLYVVGNHEHYENSYHDTIPRIRRELPDNTVLLDNESVDIDGVSFWGGTLWTDCNSQDPITAQILREGMNDFRSIKLDGQESHGAMGYYTHKFTPEYMVGEHKKSIARLKEFLNQHSDRQVVVITHHAPTFESVNEQYKDQRYMNGGYASRLDNILLDNPQISYWFHGHMHDAVDYTVGNTRVLSNPRGYVGYEMSAQFFDATKYVEINAEPSDAT